MALENVAELSQVLAKRERLGQVFARHAYGMRAWVDLFSARVPVRRRPRGQGAASPSWWPTTRAT